MTTAAIRNFERTRFVTFDAVVPFVGRALLSAIFLASVVGKLQAPAGTIGYIASTGLPFPEFAYALAVLIELVEGSRCSSASKHGWRPGRLRSSRSRPRSGSTTILPT